jgi:alkanesulfonate monooxygenase SsuD/methylene tetrahydromethanopterin reductase-like flavin-dependent oxidoreductase (luciferase family)
MSWKHGLTVVAVLGVLAATAAALALYATERERDPSYVDQLVHVPLVMGQTEREARAAIERAGLRPTVEYRHFRPRHPRIGRVIGQSPIPRVVSPGRSVMIVVSAAEVRPRRDPNDDGGWTNYAPLFPSSD